MVISAVGPVLRSAHLYGVVLKNDLQKTMLNSIPRTSLVEEQQVKNMYTISSSFCNMNTNHENLLHDQSDIKCTRIIWFTEIPWKTAGKGFFQIKSMLLGKRKIVVHDDVIDTINDPPFSMIWHEFEKMTQIDAMISIHVKVLHDDEILRKFPEDNNS